MREVGFLGVVIKLEGIKIEEKKMREVLDWPTPKGVKDIQEFLGIANYYQWSIRDFMSIIRLLHNLVKKDQKWAWTEKQEKVFKELKKKFTKEPVLAASNLNKKMRMRVDTLDYTMKEVLSMKYEDRK